MLLAAFMPGVIASASFGVSNFACTPTESAINTPFSCTVTVRNSGDAAGTAGTVTIYPDGNNWLENSNYPKTVNANVNPGESTEVTITGMKGIKTGNNGFSEVRIDNVADTSNTVTGLRVNIIDVSVSVENSATEKVMGGTFTSTADVTAGGNIDVTLTFTVNSGGCSIDNQDSQKTISGMQDGNRQSKSWTVTMGTTGDCKFTITASATGEGGVATKSDSSDKTVTCTDCPEDTGSSGSGGGGSGASSSDSSGEYSGELTETVKNELAIGQRVSFFFGGENHQVKFIGFTETGAEILVQSIPKSLKLNLWETKNVDFEDDGREDISVTLEAMNVITKKINVSISPLYIPEINGGESGSGSNEEKNTAGKGIGEIIKVTKNNKTWIIIGAAALVILAIFFARKRIIEKRMGLR